MRSHSPSYEGFSISPVASCRHSPVRTGRSDCISRQAGTAPDNTAEQGNEHQSSRSTESLDRRLHVRGRALRDFGKADVRSSVPLQQVPTAIWQRVFHGYLHQAFDFADRRRNEGLRGRWCERHAGRPALLRSVRISAHDRTRSSSQPPDGEGGRHRQQRVVSTRDGAVRYAAKTMGRARAGRPAI